MPSAFFGFTGKLDDWNLAFVPQGSWLPMPVKSGVMIPFGSSEKKVRLLRMELAVRTKTHHIAIVFRRGSVKTLVIQFLRQILTIPL